MVGLMDSASSNILAKLSWANIKATLKTYFDGLYTLSNLGGVATGDSRLSDARTPVAHNLVDTTGHPVTGLTAGHILTATSTTAYGFAAPLVTTPDADASTKGKLQLTSDLGGTAASPTVVGIHSGATALAISTITDGQFLKRVGSNIVSAEAAGNNYSSVSAGVALTQGQAVYFDTSTSKARLALNNGTQAQSNVVGLVYDASISQNASGNVICSGTLTYGTWVANKYIYLDSTAGGLTQTCPTTNGVYAIPIGIAISTTQILVRPMTGWVVSSQNIPIGFKAVTFNQGSGTVAIVTPPANAVIKQITSVISAASGAGGSLSVGVSGSVASVMDTTIVDTSAMGNYISEPYYSVGGSPVQYIVTVTKGAQTSFSGTLYFHYAIPNVVIGTGGMLGTSFTQSTSSPVLLFTPPDNSVITKCVIVVDTAATSGTPNCSIGVTGTAARDMATTDSDLLTLGTYIYEPFTDVGTGQGAVYLTLTGHGSSGVTGRAYVNYMVKQ